MAEYSSLFGGELPWKSMTESCLFNKRLYGELIKSMIKIGFMVIIIEYFIRNNSDTSAKAKVIESKNF